MAKRPNPFIEDYAQQSKIHVGLKQFNNNEERLSKVYEKTLEMLFQGAKKLQPQLTSDVVNNAPHDKRNNMKQLIINTDGTLSHSDSVVENKVVSQPCACGSTPDDGSCGYCETALCPACVHLCVRCENKYCARCSIIGSDGEMCVSCYG